MSDNKEYQAVAGLLVEAERELRQALIDTYELKSLEDMGKVPEGFRAELEKAVLLANEAMDRVIKETVRKSTN